MSGVEGAPSLRAAGVADILADRLKILQDSRLERPSRTGDVDCAVAGIDRFWPLRLRAGWRLCQRLQYDVRSWYCVLEREGEVLCVDVLDDPRGLGRDAFPSALVFTEDEGSAADGADDDVAAPAIRAAYLTLKRLRKRMRADAEWRTIASLAREDPVSYRRTLAATLGTSTAEQLATVVLDSNAAPPDSLFRRARRVQQLRRFRSPTRALTLSTLQAARLLSRARRPTGLLVVVAGPDGVGKSTLAAALPAACSGLFRRATRHHSRAGVLPRPGAVLRRPASDSTVPHAREPHGQLVSTALVFYHWLDFLSGYVMNVAHFRARTGLVVVERGWWDMAVDPVRYRISAPRRLITTLGRLLPSADVTLVLTADEDVILDRKRELPRDELARQQRRWRETVPVRDAPVYLDVARPEHEVVAAARTEIVARLERRALSRLDAGWVGMPPGADPRWMIPRGPRAVARTGIGVYNPQTVRAQSGWELGRSFASIGGLRALPRASAPPEVVREALAPHLPPRSTYALAKANHPGRFIALVIEEGGRPIAFAKVATDDTGRDALRREVEALRSYVELLPPPLSAPLILEHVDGVLLLEPVLFRRRLRPWLLPADVAEAIGTFWKLTRTESLAGPAGVAHGDFTPWNLLRTEVGWTLIDWEYSWQGAPPFFDVFHFFVQAHWLLGRPHARPLVDGIRGSGPVGHAIAAYAAGADLDPSTAAAEFEHYLHLTSEEYPPTAHLHRGVAVRKGLLNDLRHR